MISYTGTPGGGSHTHSPVVRLAYICSFVRGSMISTHSILLQMFVIQIYHIWDARDTDFLHAYIYIIYVYVDIYYILKGIQINYEYNQIIWVGRTECKYVKREGNNKRTLITKLIVGGTWTHNPLVTFFSPRNQRRKTKIWKNKKKIKNYNNDKRKKKKVLAKK